MQLVREEGVDCSVDCMSVIPTVSFVSAVHTEDHPPARSVVMLSCLGLAVRPLESLVISTAYLILFEALDFEGF